MKKDVREMTYSELLAEEAEYRDIYMGLICPNLDGLAGKKASKVSARNLNMLLQSIFHPELYPELNRHCDVLHELWILKMSDKGTFTERRK